MELYYHIDSVILGKKNDLQIYGWAFCNKGDVNFKIEGAILKSIETVQREDVKVTFKNICKTNQVGFVLYLEANKENVKLKIVSQYEEKIENIDVRKLKKRRAEERFLKLLKIIRNSNLNNVVKGFKFYRRYGFHLTWKKIKMICLNTERLNYNEWFYINHLPAKSELDSQKEIKFKYMPKISILTPTYNTPEKFLREMIDSVINQTYSNWELCIADASDNDTTRKILDEYGDKDNRIKVKYLEKNLMIAGNTNEALKLATGEYIGLLDHDDLLTENCLFEIVKLLNEKGTDIDFIYTDEDKIDHEGSLLFGPHLKQNWAPYTLYSYNYITHFTVFSKQLIEKENNTVFKSEYDGAQDFDLVLRLTEKARKIYHIPKILYHWRVHKNSTAFDPKAKLYAYEAGIKALKSHFKRKKISIDSVQHGEFLGIYKVNYTIKNTPRVSIIIPNKDHIDDLDKCIKSIEKKSTYNNYEIIIVENNSEEERTFKYYNQLKNSTKVKVVNWEQKGFNYSAINNFGFKYTSGEYIILLNNDVEIITDNWIEEMLMLCCQEKVGIVGAKLYYPDDTIQHAGVVVGLGGVAGHIYHNFMRKEHGHAGRLKVSQNLSAVTGACLMIRSDIFRDVNGLDEEYFKVAYNDIDLCLKVIEKGYYVLWTPFAELYHYESKSRGYEDTSDKIKRFEYEKSMFRKKWKDYIEQGDPYYNVNMTLIKGDCSLKIKGDI